MHLHLPRGSHSDLMVNVVTGDIEFEQQSGFNVYIRTNTHENGMKPFTFHCNGINCIITVNLEGYLLH